jgi:hypothetical protein
MSEATRFDLKTIVVTALTSSIFTLFVTFAVTQYQQHAARSNLRMAFAGEIEVVMWSLMKPVNFGVSAWEEKRRLSEYKFYAPRAVYEANLNRLGDLGSKDLVRDITYLYSTIQQAREEGRRLETGTADDEGMLYVSYLVAAYTRALMLTHDLVGESSLSRDALLIELKRLKEISKK